jgi:6-phosphogluconolactonase
MTTPEIKVLPTPDAVAREAADRIVRIADESIAKSGRFTIALSGGSTPKALYEMLAREPYKSGIDWTKTEVFFADERCVPPDHAESNYRMVREALLSEVPIPGDNVYRIRGEIEPEEAAKEYGLMLKEKFGDSTDSRDATRPGRLDLILLGMGEDGHTASLFPGTSALDETKHRVVALYVERSTTGKSWRITMTAPFINRARNVIILVTGASKAKRLAEVLEGPRDPQRLPVQLIAPQSGRLTWLIAAAAAGMGGDEEAGGARG